MKFLRGLLVIVAMLGLLFGLGSAWPGTHRFLDLMIVPVVWFGVRTSQRQATLGGCVAGLLHDTWFEPDAFGIGGFKATLLGWALGGLGARFDLNRAGGRFLAGSLMSLMNGLIDLPLRGILEVTHDGFRPGLLLARAVLTGCVVVVSFGALDAFARRRRTGWGG